MTIQPGSRLGQYVVQSAIGAGGLGQVFRAHDTALNRDVALKVLPELFAADPERLARFQREARLLAALNHPHIAAIYSVEQAEGRHFRISTGGADDPTWSRTRPELFSPRRRR